MSDSNRPPAGSGFDESLMIGKQTSLVVWLRRLVQTAFLLLFFYLFLQTVYKPINRTGGPVTFFFELDPLALATVWLASHTIVATLLLSLVTIAATLLFGRWFCGRVCPFGTIQNMFTALRNRNHEAQPESGGYSPRQKVKYGVLAGFLLCAATGVNVIGWLDPISFFYRSLTIAIDPPIQAGLRDLFGWLYEADPGIGNLRITAVSEPVYELLRRHFLSIDQPYFFWGLFIGFLFIGVAALNFCRARFYCRYVCPLGALLGVVGKNPLLRLSTDADMCSDCGLCLVDCQGGAEPQDGEKWRPSECFYCWNCHSNCPSQAVTFRFYVPGEKKS